MQSSPTSRTSFAHIGQLAGLLALAGGVSVLTVAAIVAATNKLEGDFRPEVALPILLVSGLIALVVALAILVGTFSIFGLTQPGAAFGLPEGTLQAVIAMMIIMIFAITSLYLNASVQTTTVTLTGLSQAEVDALPADEIQSITETEDERGNPVFEVRRLVSNRVGEDFAKQLLTTLSTLVVAVAGFYFGAKSVETGVRAQVGPQAGTGPPATVPAAPVAPVAPTGPGPAISGERPMDRAPQDDQ